MGKLATDVARLASQNPVFSGMVSLLERTDGENADLLRVLTYHRVDLPESDPSGYQRVTVRPKVFEKQMSYLATYYHPVSIEQVLQVREEGGHLPLRAVLVTFDDAYIDFADNAWPLMKKYDIPATLFVPTAFPDQPERGFWWDRLHQAIYRTQRDVLETEIGKLRLNSKVGRDQALRRARDYVKTLPHQEAIDWVNQISAQLGVGRPANRVLSWEALRQLASEGVSLGAHTRTHPLLDRVTPNDAIEEALGSMQDLEREIGHMVPIFAYPGGRISQDVVDGLWRAGVRLAFTTERGINDLSKIDWLRIRRINVGPGTTLPLLRAQLLPWMAYIY